MGVRDVLAVSEFDGLVGQKPQVPAGATLRGLRAGQGRDQSAGGAVDLDRAARARLVEEHR